MKKKKKKKKSSEASCWVWFESYKFHHVGLHLKPSPEPVQTIPVVQRPLSKSLHGLSFKEKNVKKDLPDEDGVQMWTWLFQMCGRVGLGERVASHVCRMKWKTASSHGESRTGGRGKRWGGTESKLISATQDQTNLRCLFPRELTFPIWVVLVEATPHTALLERNWDGVVPSGCWMNLICPTEDFFHVRLQGRPGTWSLAYRAEGNLWLECGRRSQKLPGPSFPSLWISSSFSPASPGLLFQQGWDIPCFSDE